MCNLYQMINPQYVQPLSPNMCTPKFALTCFDPQFDFYQMCFRSQRSSGVPCSSCVRACAWSVKRSTCVPDRASCSRGRRPLSTWAPTAPTTCPQVQWTRRSYKQMCCKSCPGNRHTTLQLGRPRMLGTHRSLINGRLYRGGWEGELITKDNVSKALGGDNETSIGYPIIFLFFIDE